MDWIAPVKDFWWLLGVLVAILAALWRLAIQTNKTKEQILQVQTNKEAIGVLQGDMTVIKSDISEIKDGVERQAEATVAILGALQSVMKALDSKGCDIGKAQEKFNDFLAHR